MPFLKGWVGEQGIRLVQMFGLDSTQYHCFYDVLVKVNGRSTQIDHVIVSKHGVFVVETKNRSGWIYGSDRDRSWTQVNFSSKTSFQNPLRQNYLHTRAIAEFCSIDHSKTHSVVVFCGDCQFKTEMPENVVGWSDYADYIKSKNRVLLNEDEVNRVCRRLETLKGGIPILTNLLHAEEIKHQRDRRDVCPRCGGKLVERTAHRGQAAGETFVGCQHYPRCRFTRKLG